ncbi:MAG TPA: CAP domain-containing protein [Vicinamibacterales bacterium]
MFKRQNTAGALFGNTPQTRVLFAARRLQLPLTGMAICLRRISLVWLLAVTCGCATPASPTEASPSDGGGAIASSIVDLTNAERANAGIAPFRTSAQLMQAAQLQADQMAQLGLMEHELPGAKYPTPADRLAAVGYRWSAYGENIAMGQSSAAAVVDAWMHSSGHRANILNSTFREIGAGYARDAAGRPYYVQVFATPR